MPSTATSRTPPTPRLTPDDTERSVIGNGDYAIAADLIGIGSTFRF